MEYTILRDGKTYDEYRDFITEQVELLDLLPGDKTKTLAKRYKENDDWFDKNQMNYDFKKRIDKLIDIDLAIHFSGLNQKNKALVVKQILEGDEITLSSLESVIPQVKDFIKKENDKKDYRENFKSWIKSIDPENVSENDKDRVIKYLIKQLQE